MTKKVLCTAPLTAALIDTNKGVRPCCVYDNSYIGNLKEQSLLKIINSEEWKKLKQQKLLNYFLFLKQKLLELDKLQAQILFVLRNNCFQWKK